MTTADPRVKTIAQTAFRFLGLSVLLIVGVNAKARGRKKAPQPRRDVWISDIRTPVQVARARLADFAGELLKAVQRGETAGELATGILQSPGPCALFLSVRPHSAKAKGKHRVLSARAFLGTGTGPVAALHDALARLNAVHAEIGPVHELKFDLVRSVVRAPDLIPRGGQVLFPGFAGLAFAPRAGIAFVPEQLSGCGLLDVQGRLRVHAVEALLTAESRWADLRIWSQLQSYPAPQPAWRFECSSVYVTETAAVPLLRGHRIFEDATINSLLDQALHLAGFLANGCARNGAFRFGGVPGWSGPTDDAGRLQPNASAVLALLRVVGIAKQAGRKGPTVDRVAAAANRALERILRRIRPGKVATGAACVVAADRSRIETDALVVLALLEARRNRVLPADDARHIEALGRYLLAQLQPDGSLVMERFYPSGNIHAAKTSLNASGLTILAMLGLYEHTGRRAYLTGASRAMLYILENYCEKKPMNELPLSPGVAAALNSIYTVTRDPRCIRQLQRIGLAVVIRQNRRPESLDLFGGYRDDTSVSTAARRIRTLLAATELLQDRHKTMAAADLLSAAGLSVLYTLSACMDAPSSFYLESPESVQGLFREDLSAFQFTFEGQVQQILALTSTWSLLHEYDKPGTVLTKADRDLLRKRDQRIEQFPRILAPGVFSVVEPTQRPGDARGPVIHPIPK